jgi:microcin C transport system permease protein
MQTLAIGTPFLVYEQPDKPRSAPRLSAINQRRLAAFRANRRGVWALWIFLVLFALTLCSEFVANDRPLVAYYKGELLFPVVIDYPETMFGGFLAQTIYRDPLIIDEINANGWAIWPPIRYADATIDESLGTLAPAPPSWLVDRTVLCARYPQGADDPSCNLGNFHWLGTDSQGRDVVARLLYGFRISVLFGLILTVASSIVGIAAGALQGFFGGWIDLVGQRLLDIWGSLPSLYVLIILSSILPQGFWILLGIMIVMSWTALVAVVRAEFLRARNLEYVAAARALGVSNGRLIVRHLLPNAMVATLTFLPFITGGSVTTLTALDFLGLGLPPGSPSLGELLNEGKQYLSAPWLALTSFVTIALILTLLVFIGEAVRDAFDSRKTFG